MWPSGLYRLPYSKGTRLSLSAARGVRGVFLPLLEGTRTWGGGVSEERRLGVLSASPCSPSRGEARTARKAVSSGACVGATSLTVRCFLRQAPPPPGAASPPPRDGRDGRDGRASSAQAAFAAGRSCVPLHGACLLPLLSQGLGGVPQQASLRGVPRKALPPWGWGTGCHVFARQRGARLQVRGRRSV